MMRFSHTATFENDGEKEIRAVFTTGPAKSELATLFSAKAAGGKRKPGDVDMSLEQVDEQLKSAATGPEAEQFKRARTAIAQHQSYEEQFANRVSKAFTAAASRGRVVPLVKQAATVSM